MNKEQFIRICPECGSDDIGVWMVGRGMVGYECRKCRYQAMLFPEMTLEAAKEFRAELKLKKI